jgi:hypothetical protein
MRDLAEFIGPYKGGPAMQVEVIDKNGVITHTFEVPPGFQLERYVDAIYPEKELMVYTAAKEVNISVLDGEEIIEIYKGLYK